MSDKHDVTELAQRAPDELAPIAREMMKRDPTPEALEKLIELQERWEDRQALKAYNMAMVRLRASLPPFIERDVLVAYGSTRYRHTSLAHAVEVLLPKLSAHGFAHDWKPGRTDTNDVQVTATIRHEGGHSESCTLHAPPDTSGHKSAAQAVASTQTLLSRYTLLALVGMATADMREDGDPEPTPAPEAIDTAANLRLARTITEAGKKREDAEKLVGRPVSEWTGEDLGKIKLWLEPGPKTDGKDRVAKARRLTDKALVRNLERAEQAGDSGWVDVLQAEIERRMQDSGPE